MDIKQRTAKQRTTTDSHNESENKQKVNINRTTTFIENGQQPKYAYYWYQIFALDSAVVEVQEMFSSHGSLLTKVMYHHGETLLSN